MSDAAATAPVPTSRALIAETVGTFALVLVGGGAIVATEGGDLLTIALAHGLVLAVMVCAFLHVSGAQFNPAVSLALVAVGAQSSRRALAFIAAQVLGAVVGAWLLKTIAAPVNDVAPPNIGQTLGSLTAGAAARPGLAVLVEAVAAFLLMTVIMGVAVDRRSAGRPVAGFAIGLVVAADILAFGPLTGASMNPARSLGPALVMGDWTMHGVYWIGPILGAVAAAVTWKSVLGTGAPSESS